MVDANLTPAFLDAVEAARREHPKTEFECVSSDFRNPDLFHILRDVDASILYEVLLHQDNYVEVIRQVCAHTRKYICVAQPCLREHFSVLPASAVLLQFYEEPLKNLLREQSFWPEEPRSELFRTDRWMWGQTISHFVDIFKGYGWRLHRGMNITNTCGTHWDYPIMPFSKI